MFLAFVFRSLTPSPSSKTIAFSNSALVTNGPVGSPSPVTALVTIDVERSNLAAAVFASSSVVARSAVCLPDRVPRTPPLPPPASAPVTGAVVVPSCCSLLSSSVTSSVPSVVSSSGSTEPSVSSNKRLILAFAFFDVFGRPAKVAKSSRTFRSVRSLPSIRLRIGARRGIANSFNTSAVTIVVSGFRSTEPSGAATASGVTASGVTASGVTASSVLASRGLLTIRSSTSFSNCLFLAIIVSRLFRAFLYSGVPSLPVSCN